MPRTDKLASAALLVAAALDVKAAARIRLAAVLDGDNLPRPGNPRTLNHRDTDAASTEHSDARSGRHLRGVQCGTDAGRHRASEERRAIQRDSLQQSFDRDLEPLAGQGVRDAGGGDDLIRHVTGRQLAAEQAVDAGA